jgi:hypothetical protein
MFVISNFLVQKIISVLVLILSIDSDSFLGVVIANVVSAIIIGFLSYVAWRLIRRGDDFDIFSRQIIKSEQYKIKLSSLRELNILILELQHILENKQGGGLITRTPDEFIRDLSVLIQKLQNFISDASLLFEISFTNQIKDIVYHYAIIMLLEIEKGKNQEAGLLEQVDTHKLEIESIPRLLNSIKSEIKNLTNNL